ncbi:DUF294 nucleotidyltransferase-like domain-containing protein [Alteribacter natronophilus]|uniref:DUF294 nucleotidyltransferase-like domain-containing protein n=1 Tax=Alteribacter natronophilus TaxID=2583810 RepID=UPI00110EA0F8|nr:DUF294 nucleotidyltransferase-like domain-containing protein [Alteribacter natronophilus]TMW73371.1 cyclic nucleotide-binding domain-containing protein [Alteribacter natronophilus]
MSGEQGFKEVMRNAFPFDLLTDEQFDMVTGDAERLSFRENEFLFHEEEEEVEVYFLLQGLAKNVLHREDGKQFSVRFYYPGDLIGLMILLSGGEMNFSVQALENCETVRLKKHTLLRVMTDNQSFSDTILTGIGQRMKSLYDEMKRDHSTSDTENVALYKTRVHTIMDKPRFIFPDQTITQAAGTLSDWGGQGLTVVDQDHFIKGTITQTELLKALAGDGAQDPVYKWMIHDPVCVQADAFSYEVLTFFKEDRINLVPVLNGEKAVGILTAESFLRLHESEYLNLYYNVSHARELDQLIALSPKSSEKFLSFTEELLTEQTYGTEMSEFISRYNDQIHIQVIRYALKEMKREGYGNPPVNYCFVVMGSQGRGEQAFSTDQDNGLILDNYRHLENRKEVEEYFFRFASKINDGLAACGFPECTGGIMAKEPKWRRSIDEWEREVLRWLRETDSQEVRDFTIFIDYRPLFGDFTLAEKLRERITPPIQKGRILQAMLMKDTIRFRVPVQPFGRISTRGKRRTIDLKKGAIMQIVNNIRIFAIRYGIEEVSTLKRLYALRKEEVFHPRDAANAKLALDYLYQLRIRENVSQLRSGEPLNNELRPHLLTKEERKQLRESLLVAKRMQQMSELSFARNRGL